MKSKSALLLGASGLIGSELLKILLKSEVYREVTILVRKSLGITHPKLKEMIIDLERLDTYKEVFKVNDVFCTLGTTIKKAKSQEQFKKVDVDYPLEMGRLAKEMQVEKFLIVTSIGADPNSKVFYSRMKGLVEEGLKALELNSLHIFRPSLLLGNRQEFRFGEKVAAVLSKGLAFIFVGPLENYKGIEGKKVALGLYQVAQGKSKGNHLYQSREIARLTGN